MRDFYPDDMAVRNRIFDAWRTAARQFGFQEYDACVVENLPLLQRKSGEEIVNQIYTFADKSGRLLALRPEMTPTLARMVAARQASLAFPLRWFTIAQCFRYERMSRGRKREHYQWNLDILGESSVSAEAELIAAAIHVLRLLGFGPSDICVHYSNRALLNDLLRRLDIPAEKHASLFLILDKQGKIGPDETRRHLTEAGLAPKTADAILDLRHLRSPREAASFLGEQTPACHALETLARMLDAYGIRGGTRFDLAIVRGLDYYTGIVFEAYDTRREFRAIFGGGRYDNLLAQLAPKSIPGVGLGFGDVVVTEILSSRRDFGCSSPLRASVAIGYMHSDQRPTAIALACGLRARGDTVELALREEKARDFFSRVGSGGYERAIYIGPDEVARGSVRVKSLTTRTEEEVPLSAWGIGSPTSGVRASSASSHPQAS